MQYRGWLRPGDGAWQRTVSGLLLILVVVEQEPTLLAVAAGGGCFSFVSHTFSFFLSSFLWETARYRLKYFLKEPLDPKQPVNKIEQYPGIRRTTYCIFDRPDEYLVPKLKKKKKKKKHFMRNSVMLSMIFFLLINVKMPTIVGILTLMSRENSI